MPLGSGDDRLLRFLDATPPAWVVTPTRRLARTLRLRVAERRAADGRPVADTPPVHSLADWLQTLGREALAAEVRRGAARGRVLLSPMAERVLWERVIADAPGDLPRQLLDTTALATTAAEAWSRVCLWGEPPAAGPATEDVEAFRNWLPAFRAHLAEGGFVTGAELSSLVAAAIRDGHLETPCPADVVVLGFEKPDPALARLVDALASGGALVHREADPALAAPATPVAWRAATPAAELRTVAARIRERLLVDPDLRIGALAPETSAWGSRLERVFEEELDPAGVLALGGDAARRFDYAEAPSLADYPLVACALDLLSLDDGPLSFEVASRILLSAYPRRRGAEAAAQESERVGRARAEANLRRERSAVLRVSGSKGSFAAALRGTGLAEAATAFEKLVSTLAAGRGARLAPGRWREVWNERLARLGWPGVLVGDIEGLVFRRWRDALDQFAALEAVESSMEAPHALARLRSICASVAVQPPSAGPRVQVMNLLDAAGLDFDVVYAIGLTSTAFPPAPRPNALLPVAWQRVQPGMPRASVEGEAQLAATVWERLLRSAPEVFVSWSASGDGNEEQSPSAFVATLPAANADPREGRPWWLASALAADALEIRPDDDAGAPLVRSGGSAILSRQSDCPFRAVAATRLGAEKLDTIAPQPDPARRGNLVHAALAKAYEDIPTSEDLKGLSDENIAEAARAAADHAIREQEDFFADAADLKAAVRFWLEDLVASWMRYEDAVRTMPWAVEALEKNFEASFPAGAADPLLIRFRPDRIDRVPGGDGVEGEGLVVLDFKTSGTPKGASLWNGERPKDPQLPLYLALLGSQGHRVDGIAFANLSARDACVLQGIGAEEFSDKFRPPGRKKDRSAAAFHARVAEWQAVLESLAAGYLGGDARVAPRDANVCRNCGSQAFCRIHELGPPDEDDEGEGDDE